MAATIAIVGGSGRVTDHLPEHSRILIAIRRRRGWSQRQLAQVLSVSRRTIIRWEHEQTDPHPGRMAFIRQLLVNIDPEQAA